MKKVSFFLALILALAILGGCAPKNKVQLTIGDLASDSMTYTYWHQNVERQYYYYIPSRL